MSGHRDGLSATCEGLGRDGVAASASRACARARALASASRPPNRRVLRASDTATCWRFDRRSVAPSSVLLALPTTSDEVGGAATAFNDFARRRAASVRSSGRTHPNLENTRPQRAARVTHDHDLRSRATASSRAPSRGIFDNPLRINTNNQNFMTRSSEDRAAPPSPPTGGGRRRRARAAPGAAPAASRRGRWPRRPRGRALAPQEARRATA